MLIQTAFIGDVILATPLITALREKYPQAEISVLVRKGNEVLLPHDPEIREVLVWDKRSKKFANLIGLIRKVRSRKFDMVINLHRFASSGLITHYSGAREKIGFSKNPFAFGFTKKVTHNIDDGTHEIERNLSLIEDNPKLRRPRIFPGQEAEQKADSLATAPYVCIAPASVWFTKQYPESGWVSLCNALPHETTIFLLGSPTDVACCQRIQSASQHPNITVLAGELSLLESAALMAKAQMNYVNDSAPLHLASAMNAPVRAVFCSTIPQFGFGPVSENSRVIEIKEPLRCRPCGLHGKKACPKGHFKCALDIQTEQFLEA